MATRSTPEPAVCTPVPVLACSHSAAPGHLLLPSRPGAESQAAARVRSNSLEQKAGRKPRRSGLLIFRAGGDSTGSLPAQALFVSSRRSEHQKSTPDSILSPPLGSCALALGSHLGDADASRRPRRGKRVHPGRTRRRRRVVLREILKRLNPKSLRAPLAGHCSNSAAPQTQVRGCGGRRRRAATSRLAFALRGPKGDPGRQQLGMPHARNAGVAISKVTRLASEGLAYERRGGVHFWKSENPRELAGKSFKSAPGASVCLLTF